MFTQEKVSDIFSTALTQYHHVIIQEQQQFEASLPRNGKNRLQDADIDYENDLRVRAEVIETALSYIDKISSQTDSLTNLFSDLRQNSHSIPPSKVGHQITVEDNEPFIDPISGIWISPNTPFSAGPSKRSSLLPESEKSVNGVDKPLFPNPPPISSNPSDTLRSAAPADINHISTQLTSTLLSLTSSAPTIPPSPIKQSEILQLEEDRYPRAEALHVIPTAGDKYTSQDNRFNKPIEQGNWTPQSMNSDEEMQSQSSITQNGKANIAQEVSGEQEFEFNELTQEYQKIQTNSQSQVPRQEIESKEVNPLTESPPIHSAMEEPDPSFVEATRLQAKFDAEDRALRLQGLYAKQLESSQRDDDRPQDEHNIEAQALREQEMYARNLAIQAREEFDQLLQDQETFARNLQDQFEIEGRAELERLQRHFNVETKTNVQLKEQELLARQLQDDEEREQTIREAQRLQQQWDAEDLQRAQDAKLATEENEKFKLIEEEEQREKREDEARRKARQAECVVCSENYDKVDMAVLKCQHAYCIECLRQGVNTALKDKKPFHCCNVRVPIASFAGKTDAALAAAYDAMLLERDTPDPLYCANNHCPTFIPPSCVKADVGTCPQCDSRTCKLCKKLEHPDVCDQDHDGVELMLKAEKEKWKQCPHCHILVERNEGCLHMTCRCGTEFCYNCGRDYGVCPGTCPRNLTNSDLLRVRRFVIAYPEALLYTGRVERVKMPSYARSKPISGRVQSTVHQTDGRTSVPASFESHLLFLLSTINKFITGASPFGGLSKDSTIRDSGNDTITGEESQFSV
ncbi:MAG: hypothetical protein M1834_008389 [Cirrosporium novae-zelandiae]|nr:MAG: hypothetical protein M1834_008389 [Cirrosporium novae-zelandiae]